MMIASISRLTMIVMVPGRPRGPSVTRIQYMDVERGREEESRKEPDPPSSFRVTSV